MSNTRKMILEHLIHNLDNFDRDYNIALKLSYIENVEDIYLNEND